MKNIVKLFGIALAVLIGFAMTACPIDPLDDGIKWTAIADGASNTTTSTKITFTFSEAITGLAATDITITNGTGSATKGALTGSGTSWELGITVNTQGYILVRITKGGVSGIPKNVTVHKSTSSDITWTLDQVGGVAGVGGAAPTATTTAVTITFSAAVNNLTDTEITIGGAATRNSSSQLSSEGNVWTVPVTVTHSDNATVNVTKAGVASGQKTVMVYKEGEAQAITWEAEADGETDTTDSTKITFTFSEAVTGLDADDITLTEGTGSAMIGTLTGSGTSWELGITVNTQGDITVKIDKDGISTTEATVQVYKAAAAQDITWTATADGTEGSADSTKITFTFTSAVTGLALNDITLSERTGKAAKGSSAPTTSDNGITWELGITVDRSKAIVVKVSKDGVNTAAQIVKVHKSGVGPANPVSGVITWIYDMSAYSGVQIVFSDSNNGSGTYELNGFDWSSNEYDQLSGEGDWTWDGTAQIVTLTASKVADWSGELMDKTEYGTAKEAEIREEIEGSIAYSVEYEDMEEEDAEQFYLDYYNEQLGTNYTTVEEYIEGETAKAVAAVFDSRPYNYIYSSDNTLILLEALPESDGTDELAGETFHLAVPDWAGGYEKDESSTFVFAATGNTFTATVSDPYSDNTSTVTGSYSYDSTTKQVYLKPDTIGGQTPAQFYDAAEVSEWSNYPTEADDRTAQTNENYTVAKLIYDLDEKILIIGGGIDGFSATKDSVRQRSR